MTLAEELRALAKHQLTGGYVSNRLLAISSELDSLAAEMRAWPREGDWARDICPKEWAATLAPIVEKGKNP